MPTHSIPYTGSQIDTAIGNALTYATEPYLPLTGGNVSGDILMSNTVSLSSLASDGTTAEKLIYLSANNKINIGASSSTNITETYLHTALIVDRGSVTINNSSASFRAMDSNGAAKNLIYMSSADVVTINGGSAKTSATAIGTNTTIDGTMSASSHIYWGGASGWNGGVSGGFADTTGQMCIISDTSSRYPRINFVVNKKTSSGGYTQLRANNTSTSTNYTLTLPNSTGTIATSSSDMRLKKNIEDTEVNGLELISKIRLRQFDWKEEGHEGSPHWNVGMIADEIEKLDSNLVFGGGIYEDGSLNVKGVDNFYLMGYVIKAIQELKREIERR